MKATDFQKKVWYNALTAFCIVVIGALLVGGIWLSGEVLAYLQPVLVPLAVAGIFAYLIEPIVAWLERWKLSRIKSILIVFFMGIVAVTLFSWMIAAPLSNQIKELNQNRSQYIDAGRKMVVKITEMEAVVAALPAPVQEFIKERQGPQEAPAEQRAPETQPPATAPPASLQTTELTPDQWGTAQPDAAAPDIRALLQQELETQGLPQGNAVREAVPKAVIVETAEEVAEETAGFMISEYFSMESLMEVIGKTAPDFARKMVDAVTRGTSKIFGVLGYALGFIMVPIYLFFFLKESKVIQERWASFVPLRASKFKDEVVDVVAEINAYLIAFFRGQVLVSVIDGVLVGLVLLLFGHPFAILIGIALAVLGVIPFLGNIICLVPAAVTAYAHFSVAENQYWIGDNPWMYVLLVVAIFIIVQQINSLVTAPKIVGDSVGLHPMTVIFSMLFWSLLLGGFLGALLAVPLTASVKVLFSRYVWERRVMADGSMAELSEQGS